MKISDNMKKIIRFLLDNCIVNNDLSLDAEQDLLHYKGCIWNLEMAEVVVNEYRFFKYKEITIDDNEGYIITILGNGEVKVTEKKLPEEDEKEYESSVKPVEFSFKIRDVVIEVEDRVIDNESEEYDFEEDFYDDDELIDRIMDKVKELLDKFDNRELGVLDNFEEKKVKRATLLRDFNLSVK